MKELEVGETAVIGGIKVQCCRCIDNDCFDCFFYNLSNCHLAGPCTSDCRTDNNYVYFKKVESLN
jgi:hypothetical protein